MFEFAHRRGVSIEFADLGSWGKTAELRAEYDPSGPTIRINTRALARRRGPEITRFMFAAVAHEMYHHHEHRREIRKMADRAERERAADRFARELLRSPQ